MILQADHLSRQFIVRESTPGLTGKIRDLFGGRRKRTVPAVSNISFSIRPGEVVGLIGPNGAGKSTMVKLCTGIIPTTSGAVRLFDTDPFKHRIDCARRYGVVFGQRSQLWWSLSPAETFKALATIYQLPAGAAREQADYLINILDLRDFLKTPVRLLSLGQRVRCDIAAALLHQPELLFLDEPTIGLDVVAKCKVRDYVKRLNTERQVTVLLTSHDMVDVERLCARVLVIDKGRLVYDGPLAALRDEFGPEREMVVDFSGEPGLPEIPGVHVIRKEGNRLVLRSDRRNLSAMDILEKLSVLGEVIDFSVQDPPIDEVIARMYQAKQPPSPGRADS